MNILPYLNIFQMFIVITLILIHISFKKKNKERYTKYENISWLMYYFLYQI